MRKNRSQGETISLCLVLCSAARYPESRKTTSAAESAVWPQDVPWARSHISLCFWMALTDEAVQIGSRVCGKTERFLSWSGSTDCNQWNGKWGCLVPSWNSRDSNTLHSSYISSRHLTCNMSQANTRFSSHRLLHLARWQFCSVVSCQNFGIIQDTFFLASHLRNQQIPLSHLSPLSNLTLALPYGPLPLYSPQGGVCKVTLPLL